MNKQILVGVLCLGLPMAHAAPIARYAVSSATVTELPRLGGAQSTAYDINAAGHVVGWSLNSEGVRRAFVYRDESLVDITAPFGTSASEAHGINNLGEVVGFWRFRSHYHAFRHSPGGLVLLADQDLPTGAIADGSYAVAISDNGRIAGARMLYVSESDWYSNATVWRDEYSFTTLASHYDWPSWTTDVNSAGMVIGFDSDWGHSYRWQVEDGAPMSRLRVPQVPDGVDFSYYEGAYAEGLNEHGHVVGFVWRADSGVTGWRRRAFYWAGVSSHIPREIGVLAGGTESVALDINNGTFIAGYANETAYRLPELTRVVRNRAFLYHAHFGLYALPVPFLTGTGDCAAMALNDRSAATGRISVVGMCDFSSGPRAVRWDVTVRLVTPPSSTP